MADVGVGSHFPVLAAAVARTTGPVLELGCGWFSTPMLRLLCRHLHPEHPQWRRLESYDTDKDWAAKFAVPIVKDWTSWQPAEKHYGVAFVDNSPGESRVGLIKRLKGHARFIIAHDTEADIPPSGGNYGWAQLNGLFKYAVTFNAFRPWTTIYSDEEEFAL